MPQVHRWLPLPTRAALALVQEAGEAARVVAQVTAVARARLAPSRSTTLR
jgi:hypothetical protein